MWTGVQCGLFIFNARKNQLVSFERSIDSGSIDVNMNGLALEEKSSFKILELSFSSKLDWNFYVFCIAKAASKKIGALIGSKNFLLLRLLFFSINLWGALKSSLLQKPPPRDWCLDMCYEVSYFQGNPRSNELAGW